MIPTPESYYQSTGSITAKHIYAVGYTGDSDPGYALEDVQLYNSGTVDLLVGASLTGVLGSAFWRVKAGTSVTLEGSREGFVLYNEHAATAGAASMSAIGWQRNAGKDGGVKARKDNPASTTRYYVTRPSKTAGQTVSTSIVIRQRCTIASLKMYSVTVPSGATITLDLLDGKSRSLLASPYNLETLVTATLTSATLTTSTDLRTIEAGTTLTLSYLSSAGGDTLGDLLVELAVTEA